MQWLGWMKVGRYGHGAETPSEYYQFSVGLGTVLICIKKYQNLVLLFLVLITLTVSKDTGTFISKKKLRFFVRLTAIINEFIANLSTNFLINFDSYIENIKIIDKCFFLALFFDKLAKKLFGIVNKFFVKSFPYCKFHNKENNVATFSADLIDYIYLVISIH